LDDIIAIDGPAGSGKSTMARLLAKSLGYNYIDTGAMYRAFTLKAIRRGLDLNNTGDLDSLTEETEIDILNDSSGNIKVMLDNEDVTRLLRTPELTGNIASIAKQKNIRQWMMNNQRRIGNRGKCVFEGRDIGTVVFPEVRHKFYLDAEFSERARRRHRELSEDGSEFPLEEVEKDLKVRDYKDMNREVAPLKRAEDAIYLDTTNMDIDEVVEKLLSYVK